MSDNRKAYVKTILDDGRYGIIGAVQSGAKFPARFQLRPKADEYNGYTNTFVEFITRTGIENDTNKGLISAKIPANQAYEILAAIKGAKPDMEKIVWDYSDKYWTNKQMSKEPAVLAKIVVGVNKDGIIYLSVLDARNDSRAKIPFYFGHNPAVRAPFLTSLEANKFEMSMRAAQGWVAMIEAVLPDELKRVYADAIGGVKDNGPDEPRSNSGSGNSTSYAATDMDDDLPF